MRPKRKFVQNIHQFRIELRTILEKLVDIRKVYELLSFGSYTQYTQIYQLHLFNLDFSYISAVKNYYNVLLPIIKPLLYKNGGPILMIQIENEYGSVGACNHNYTSFLRDMIWNQLGNDVVLYTSKMNFLAISIEEF